MQNDTVSAMITDISEQSLPLQQLQMLRVLIKRMLTETNPDKLELLTQQIRRIANANSDVELSRKAA
ncbi:MAG: hypothetical protein DMG80_09265 [Acidobacteria bacterium]|nr:MAG: hypothetical protein DMG80_09265 [Acidobacteriota bacterium]